MGLRKSYQDLPIKLLDMQFSERLSVHRNRHPAILIPFRSLTRPNASFIDCGMLFAFYWRWQKCRFTKASLLHISVFRPSLSTQNIQHAQLACNNAQMSIVKLEASWSGDEDVESNSPCSDQMQNSPTSSQSSARSDGDLENLGSPVVQQGRRKMKRRKKRMLTGVSRQRRAANERERRRIQGVNRAFVELRNALPVANTVDISKIDILRVATKWIEHLTKLLDQDQRTHVQTAEYRDSEEPQLYEILGEEFCINDREMEDHYFLQGQGKSLLSHLCLFTFFIPNAHINKRVIGEQMCLQFF